MENQQGLFDFAAYVGLTKHLGGGGATDALAELCHIGPGSYVLDVGCGAGATPCHLARKYDCRVMGVDIRAEMVERSRERTAREGLMDKVDFRVADAQDLPFEDGLFDAVITESVTAFPEDKPKAVRDYARVTKAGGYVGLNEGTWLKVPPPPEVAAWAAQDLGSAVKPLTSEEWKGLLTAAGLHDVVAKAHAIDTKEEEKGILQRYGWGGLLRVLRRMVSLYMRNPYYRQFVGSVRRGGITPSDLTEYFGYGFYIGRK